MRNIGPMLRRCALAKCERQAEYLLDDGRVICGFHAGLFFAGATIVEKHNTVLQEAAEAAIVKPLVDEDLETDGEGEGS